MEVAICKITEKCLGCVQSQRKISLSSLSCFVSYYNLVADNRCPTIVLKIIVQFEINPNFPRGGHNYPPLLINRNFSRTERPLDLRPVSKLDFVLCGMLEKNPSALSFLV